MENTKTLVQTKTFWIAVLQALLGAIVVFGTAYPDFGGLLIAKSVLDMTLRYITAAPVSGIISA